MLNDAGVGATAPLLQSNAHKMEETITLNVGALVRLVDAAGRERAVITATRELTMPPPPHVLAIDNDAAIRQLISDYLGDSNLRVTAVATSAHMEKILAEQAIDIVLVDLRVAGEYGIQLAGKPRGASEIPIIIVSERNDEADRVMALELGADDYVTKPFSPRELVARVRAVLRRYEMSSTVPRRRNGRKRAYRLEGWELNLHTRRLTG